MGTTPLSLVATTGTYVVVSGRLISLYRGTWILDVEIGADSYQKNGAPSGRVTVTFGGVPMIGTVDAGSSGSFGPTASVRVVGGGNGWSTSAPMQSWHFDNGVPSTLVYQAIAMAVGETLVDLSPTTLGTDYAYNGNDPASAVFGDNPWFVDATGTTYHGPRPASVADASLVIRDFDAIQQKISFSCDTVLLPNTPLVDTRFGAQTFVAYNVEQIFDGNGSTGWAWVAPPSTYAPGVPTTSPASVVVDGLKSAVLHWARGTALRAYRYRVVLYDGALGGGPNRFALQPVTPSEGAPPIDHISPWSGVPGIVSELAPAMECLVVFEGADPTLPRVIAYSLVTSGSEPPTAQTSLPKSTTIDASTAINVGPSAAGVVLAGGTAPIGRVGDQVKATLTSADIATILDSQGKPCSGGPITLTGTITAGSPKVTSG